jgi:putative component of toxin-antitoxin plasmid stabilization module
VQILEYLDDAGRSPFGRWFDSLDAQAAAKVTVALRIAQGNLSNAKGIAAGILECRIHSDRDIVSTLAGTARL